MASLNNTTTTTTHSSANLATISTLSSGLLLALALFAVAIHKLKLLSVQQKPKQGPLPPGPKPLPIIGSLHKTVVNKPVFKWIHDMMDEMNTKIACFRLGRVNVIAITCPEIAYEILCKQDGTFSSRPVHMSTEISTYGYLTIALTPLGMQWKKMRRIVTSEVLALPRHRWLESKRVEEADHLTQYVYNTCNTGAINVRLATQQYSGNVIRRLMLNKRYFGKGRPDGGPGPEEIEHVEALFTILGYINAFSLSDYLPWLRLFDLDGHEEILRQALESIKKYNDPVIDQRIHLWREEGIKKNEEDILDVLIQLTDPNGAPLLTSNEIKAQILDLMLAAVDNPSNAVEWALAEMINQPQILQKAIDELDAVVGKDRQVQESDLPKLNYVKACAREAFRLHPISAFNVPHVSIADTHVSGYFIPKGSHVLVSRFSLGRNPKVWKDPLKFDPDRHLRNDGSEVVLVDPKLGLLSFSIGRRGCPGVLLGSSMTTMLLARLVHGFTWSCPPNVSSSSLIEAQHDLSMAKPLFLMARPRLSKNLYPVP